MPAQTSDGGLIVPRPSLDRAVANSTRGGNDLNDFASSATTIAANGPSTAAWMPTHPYARGGLTNSSTATGQNSSSSLPSDRNASASSHTLLTRPSHATLINDVEISASMGISFPELDGRDPADQLELLRDMLEKETRLKEGAVNFLRMDLDVSSHASFGSASRNITQSFSHSRMQFEPESNQSLAKL